jgi:hypothetical protein
MPLLQVTYPLLPETSCHLALCRLTLVCSLTKVILKGLIFEICLGYYLLSNWMFYSETCKERHSSFILYLIAFLVTDQVLYHCQ